MYKIFERSAELEQQYLGLLRKQTADFRNRQAEIKRFHFIEQHKSLIDELEQNSNSSTDQLRRDVLALLEQSVTDNGLFEVGYEFLSTQQFLEINGNTMVLRDSLKLNGAASNMVVFNQAMNRLENGSSHFFELRACDIRRREIQESDLQFECVLSWYFLA